MTSRVAGTARCWLARVSRIVSRACTWPACSWVASLLAVLAAASSARAQVGTGPWGDLYKFTDQDPDNCHDQKKRAYALCTTEPGDPCYSPLPAPNVASMCWWSIDWFKKSIDVGEASSWDGFPLNLNLVQGPMQGSLPPVTHDTRTGTLPMVPADAGQAYGPVPVATRAIVEGISDMVTGSPLLSEPDFELPFGGATYRHVRTYAEPPGVSRHEHNAYQQWVSVSTEGAHQGTGGLFWDSTGQGWMLGASPVLLIDARYYGQGLLADGVEVPRCYLIPDAHRVVPFDMLDHDSDSSPRYEAPPHLDAAISYKEADPAPAWDYQAQKWTTPPAEWYVWLNRRGLKYTFEPFYEDVAFEVTGDPPAWRSMHERRSLAEGGGVGTGVPYYATLKRIEDRYGNRIEIVRARQERSDFDPPQVTAEGCGDCHSCFQNCHEKGQIAWMKLYPAQSETAEWTLVFVYRSFGQSGRIDAPEHYPYNESTMVYATLAYNRDIPDAELEQRAGPRRKFTVEQSAFTAVAEDWWDGLELYDENGPYGPIHRAYRTDLKVAIDMLRTDPRVDPLAVCTPALPGDWTYEARYLYTDATDVFHEWTDSQGVSYRLYADDYDPERLFGAVGPPRLLLAEVREQRLAATGPGNPTLQVVRTTPTAYRYAATVIPDHGPGGPGFSAGRNTYDETILRAVFRSGTLAEIRRGYEAAGGEWPARAEHWPNDLLTLDEETQSVPIEHDGALTSRLVCELPDERFVEWEGAHVGISQYGDFDSFGPSPFAQEMVDDYIGPSARERLIGHTMGTHVLSLGLDNSSDGTEWHQGRRWFKIYPFVELPAGLSGETYPGSGVNTPQPVGSQNPWYTNTGQGLFQRWILHPGERVWPQNFLGYPDGYTAALPDAPFWIVVIDEHKDPTLESQGYGDPNYTTISALDPDDPRRPLSRRVVWLNARGFVLKEKVWSFETGTTTSIGFLERVIYDEHGRITQRRTVSWDAADQRGQGDSQGLIRIYHYNDPTGPDAKPSMEIAAEGLQQGAGELAAKSWTRQVFRDPDRPELPAGVAEFRRPVSSLLPFTPPTVGSDTPDAAISAHHIVFFPLDPGQAETDKRVRLRMSIAPPAAEAPGGTPLYAIDAQVFDEQGRQAWHIHGNVADPFDAGAGAEDRLYFDVLVYDGESTRLNFAVADAPIGQNVSITYPPGFSPKAGEVVTFDAPSAGDVVFSRPAAEPAAATLITSYRYEDGLGRPTAVRKPNGAVDFSRRRYLNDEVAEVQLAYPSAEYVGPVKVRVQVFDAGMELSFSEDAVAQISEAPHVPTGYEALTVTSRLTPEYDANGRVTSLTHGGPSPEDPSVSASVNFNQFGQVGREKAADGTITRTVTTPRGWVERVYRGTSDDATYWGGAEADDSMILVEKRFYTPDDAFGPGSTLHVQNVHQLRETRSYRERPTEQYSASTQENQAGWATQVEYDWRLRPVVRTSFRTGPTAISSPGSANPAVLSRTYTWYDNLDRERLVAVYRGDAEPPMGSIDPRSAAPGDDAPAAASVLAVTPQNLVSLSETVYDARGLVRHRFDYEPGQTNAARALRSLSYFDHRGREVYSRAASGGVRRTTYDGAGRSISSATIVAGPSGDPWESSRTDTQNDGAGNAIVITSWERRHDAWDSSAGAALSSSNAVASYTFNWYDNERRLIATADLGTANFDTAGSRFAYAPAPARASAPPVQYDANGAFFAFSSPVEGATLVKPRMTGYQFDASGRRTRVVHPSGAVTAYRYDAIGNIVQMVDNADDPIDVNRRVTAYQNDSTTGRLIRTASVHPPFVFIQLPSPFVVVDWALTDGSVRITELSYADSALSAGDASNGAWVRDVRFPDPETGQPITGTPSFAFSYFADGLVKSRTDRAGYKQEHQYDELGLLTETAATYPTDLAPSNLLPNDLITKILFEHDGATGRLTRVKAQRNSSQGVPGPIVADTQFLYDARGNLLRDLQQQGTEGGETYSPAVNYVWDYSPYDPASTLAGNYDRLLRIHYPPLEYTDIQRRLKFEYGTPNSVANTLSRVSALFQSVDGAAYTEVARYDYCGDGRRISCEAINPAGVAALSHRADLDTALPGYEGLTAFGEPADVQIRSLVGHGTGTWATAPLVRREQHGYDDGGRRLFDRISRRLPDGSLEDNQRSRAHAYDLLDRLVQTDAGVLDPAPPAGQAPQILAAASGFGSFPRRTSFELDSLGHRSGGEGASPQPFGRLITGDFDGDALLDERRDLHAADFDNTLSESIVTTAEGGVPGAPATTTLIFDPAGRLAADATYFYQYDAWHRMVSVRDRGSLTFDATGRVTGGNAGSVKVRFTYDGLGRLIRRLTRYPGVQGAWRSEHYIHDGVRRIQETITDPIAASAPFDVSEEEELEPITWGDREFVHHAGTGSGVDDVLATYDALGAGWFVVQDASTDVVALVSHAGTGTGGGGGGGGGSYTGSQVSASYVWDPYGDLLASELDANLLANSLPRLSRLGHHGLMHDRLDADTLQPTLVVGSAHTIQNRNRTYLPSLGRFAQGDPNGTGQGVMAAAGRSALVRGAEPDTYSHVSHTSSELNTHAYLGMAPVMHQDPSGLFYAGIGPTDTLELGIELGIAAYNLVDQYSADLEAYTAWASDWELDDDLFDEAQTRHDPAELFGDLGLESDVNIGPLGNATTASIQAAIKGARLFNKVRAGAMYSTYHAARYAARAAGRKLDAHHIVEKRVLRALGMDTNGPAILLTRAQHRLVTKLLARHIPNDPKKVALLVQDRGALIRAYSRAYEDFPELLDVVLTHLGGG